MGEGSVERERGREWWGRERECREHGTFCARCCSANSSLARRSTALRMAFFSADRSVADVGGGG